MPEKTAQNSTIDPEIINSLHLSIQQSDQNAVTLIDIIKNDTDMQSLAAALPSDDNAALPVYLHAVYHGASKTQTYLQQHINAAYIANTSPPSILSRLTGLQLALQGANDVCWAALSDHPDALSALIRTYESLEKHANINARTAQTISTQGFRDQEARNLTPLDITVQYYVAHSAAHAAQGRDSELPEILQAFLRQAANTQEKTACAALQTTEKNIWDLLDSGATGSNAAYFPTSPESLQNPFVNNDGFEVMSLTDFCSANKHYLPAELARALCHRNQHPAPSRAL